MKNRVDKASISFVVDANRFIVAMIGIFRVVLVGVGKGPEEFGEAVDREEGDSCVEEEGG